ncbi:transglutaminase family protein [Verrucomicrobiales bacterium BCK34]|nr:transglutaminase family protein [Verrucomicrobiales bacterium BCK34]
MTKEVCYQIRHLTAYEYTGRIDLCQSIAHLKPLIDGSQKTIEHSVEVHPKPHFQTEREDYWNNGTLYFEVQGSHQSLKVIATSKVVKRITDPVVPRSGAAWDDVSARLKMGDSDEKGLYFANFLLPTLSCPRLEEIDEFLEPSLQPGRDSMELVSEIMTRINTEFDYVPGATDTTTPVVTLLKNKQGVCQDFAHVMIVALRRLGIPVRYVSGYLETLPPPGVEKLQGSDATHAWVEAYSRATGWVGFDPTNNIIPAHQHIKIGHGRDYFDLQPLKGTFVGNGNQRLTVEVDVERC